jgi:hypothetical protein
VVRELDKKMIDARESHCLERNANTPIRDAGRCDKFPAERRGRQEWSIGDRCIDPTKNALEADEVVLEWWQLWQLMGKHVLPLRPQLAGCADDNEHLI